MPVTELKTICGYELADIRKSLRDAIDRRDRRAAHRWTAELVATPGAIGSLWAAYWMAWASSSATPVLAILLKQTWTEVAELAHELQDWKAFRNNAIVRARTSEMTTRFLDQTRQTPVIWPSREITLYDVSTMRSATTPAETDGPVVMGVWQRTEDALEYRMMAGRFITSLVVGDLRTALSAVAWTMLAPASQGLQTALKCADRGPASLSLKARCSPLWFWLDIGRFYISKRSDLHPGWITMHHAIADAFREHYKRWTMVDRMRMLLAWILQLRSSMIASAKDEWTVNPIHQEVVTIDIPYKEIAAELDPVGIIQQTPRSTQKQGQTQAKTLTDEKMADADAAIYAFMGLSDDA